MNLNSVSAETRKLIASAANRLLAAGANPEQIAVSTPARRLLGILPLSSSFKKAGEGFLLGALVVTTQGDVFEPGLIIRASLKVLPGHQAQSAQERLELRRKLLAAKFPQDSAVLIDPRPVADRRPRSTSRGKWAAGAKRDRCRRISYPASPGPLDVNCFGFCPSTARRLSE